jgi:hypothetical protein
MRRKGSCVAVIGVGLVAAALLSGGSPERATAQSIVGWTCLPTFGGCDEYGTPASTANAVVGLPFKWDLVAGCNTAQWDLQSADLNTGRLPPGLEFEYYTYNIMGVPTRAGSFSFQMLFRGISCPGANYLPYGDYTANFTIVVTGN